jgi:hypothetical protein
MERYLIGLGRHWNCGQPNRHVSGVKFFLPRVGAALLDPGFDLVVGGAGVVEVDAEVGFGHGFGGAFYLVLTKIDSDDDESFGLGALDLNHSISS